MSTETLSLNWLRRFLPAISRLFRSMEFWQSIGTLDFILDVIKEGYKIPFIFTPPPKHYSNNASALREADFVDHAIA